MIHGNYNVDETSMHSSKHGSFCDDNESDAEIQQDDKESSEDEPFGGIKNVTSTFID